MINTFTFPAAAAGCTALPYHLGHLRSDTRAHACVHTACTHMCECVCSYITALRVCVYITHGSCRVCTTATTTATTYQDVENGNYCRQNVSTPNAIDANHIVTPSQPLCAMELTQHTPFSNRFHTCGARDATAPILIKNEFETPRASAGPGIYAAP